MVGNRRTHGYPKGSALRAFFSDWRNTLPIAGLDTPSDIAVDNEGNVYVSGQANRPVVRLSAT